MTSFLARAGDWFLRSGIQESGGGIARFHRTDAGANAPVSNEITGYGVSALGYLYWLDPCPEYQEAAIRAATYLTDRAWDESSHTFPFEPGSGHAYFFDTGIIARGLLGAWRLTGEERFRDRARQAALSLAFDFLGDGVFHPSISIPDKRALDEEPRWSRRPGCYQLKSAMAWREMEDAHASRCFEIALEGALATHPAFLPGDQDREKVMDRLHAYCYFLEGLLAADGREGVRIAMAEGVARATALRLEIAPHFERADVCAQLLRVRLIAHHLDLLPLDEKEACEEADRVASYQADSGGFWFGAKGGVAMPFLNPATTGFCMQALALWQQHKSGTWSFKLHQLI